MNTPLSIEQESIWNRIESEKQRDRFIRRISFIAWSMTLFILLVFTVMIGIEVFRVIGLVQVGMVTASAVISTLMPLVAVLGVVSLLVAVLSTIGVFFRLRTSSLSEIQLRLAALEEILITRFGAEEAKE